MSGLERLGGASQDLSAAASLLGYSDRRESKSADDLVSHPRFCFLYQKIRLEAGYCPPFSISDGRAVARL
jgi:hypothetical protein